MYASAGEDTTPPRLVGRFALAEHPGRASGSRPERGAGEYTRVKTLSLFPLMTLVHFVLNTHLPIARSQAGARLNPLFTKMSKGS